MKDARALLFPKRSLRVSLAFVFLPLVFILTIDHRSPGGDTSAFILTVQELLFLDQFEETQLLCDEYISENDADPTGYLFKAAALWGEMSDREEKLYEKQFKELIDTVIELCDSRLDTCQGRTAAYQFLWRGHAHVYRSFWESRFGSFASAIKNGFNAHGDYSQGLKHDSTLYDLYFGMGNYHYWKSVKAGILRTLGIFSNDIEKGIRELKLAVDSASLFSDAARSSLIWILIDRSEYNAATTLAEQMLEKYPDSRTLRWPLGVASYHDEEYEQAIQVFIDLRQHFAENSGNYYNLIECDYYLYKCYRSLDQVNPAESLLVNVEQYRSEVPKSTKRRQRTKLNYLKRELRR